MIEMKLSDKTLIMDIKDPREVKLIKDFLTYENTKSAFAYGSYHQEYVTKKCMAKEIKGAWVCFPGLANEIVKFCKQSNIQVTKIEDNRTHFKYEKEEIDYRSLLPNFDYVEHQIRALEKLHHTSAGIIKATTSAGKSAIASALIRMTGLKTLVVVDKVTLAQQLYDGLKKDGVDVGICSGKGIIQAPTMISTIQSVKKIQHYEFDMVIADEVHHASAKTYQDLLKKKPFAKRYGFSASPFNSNYLDFVKIRQFFGSIICDIEAKELIENNVITRPVITFVKTGAPDAPDYPTSYRVGIVENMERNKKIKEIADNYEEGVAVLVNLIDHGEMLEKMIDGAIFIRGSTSTDDRREAMKAFEEGRIRVLIGSTILDEGISINNIRTLIIASGGKGLVKSVQRVGRALRKKEGKIVAEIFDFEDYGNYFLERHGKLRKKIYEKNGFEVIK
jgi:superfamily II DNA or RNA helicase